MSHASQQKLTRELVCMTTPWVYVVKLKIYQSQECVFVAASVVAAAVLQSRTQLAKWVRAHSPSASFVA